MQIELHLGHRDAEMDRIIFHANMSGVPFIFLTSKNTLCDARNAYAADWIYTARQTKVVVIEGQEIKVPRIKKTRKTEKTRDIISIDHHRLNIDPGASMGPDEYWKASSLGQLCKLLGHKPNEEDLTIAAADHCLAAAVQGECPGVYGPDVVYHRIHEIAAEFNLDSHAVEMRVQSFCRKMPRASVKIFDEQEVLDLRRYRFAFKKGKYSIDLLILQVALAMEGKAALVCFTHQDNTPEVIMLTGYVREKTVYAFWDWTKKQGLVNHFGVPLRGHGGAERSYVL